MDEKTLVSAYGLAAADFDIRTLTTDWPAGYNHDVVIASQQHYLEETLRADGWETCIERPCPTRIDSRTGRVLCRYHWRKRVEASHREAGNDAGG